MPDDRLIERRCDRAARAMAWWGRISAAAWLLEAITREDLSSGLFPVLLLAAVAEAQGPRARRGRGLGGILFFQAVVLIWSFYYFWFVAEDPLESGRTLGLAGAILVLGILSFYQGVQALRVVPKIPSERSAESVRRSRAYAGAVGVMLVLLGVFVAILLGRTGDPKLAGWLVFHAALGIALVRMLAAGEGHAIIGVLAALLTLASGGFAAMLMLAFPGDPLAILSVLICLLSVVAIVLGSRAIHAARQERKTRPGEQS